MTTEKHIATAEITLKLIRLMFHHHPWKLVLILALSLFMGLFGGFSVVLLIPLLQMVGGNGDPSDQPARFLHELAHLAGVQLSIGSILLIFLLILTLNAALRYWKSILEARYQQTFINSYRRRLFTKILHAGWESLHANSKTNHIQVLTVEVPNMAEYLFYALKLITSLVITMGYIFYAMALSAGYTLLILAIGGSLFFLLRKFLSRAFRLGEGYINSYNRLLKYIDDFWQTVKLAKVHGSENFYSRKFDEANTTLLDLEFRIQQNYHLPQLIYRVAGIAVLSLLIFLTYRSGEVPLTSLFVLILLFAKIFPQFTGLITDINMIISTTPSVRMVLQLDAAFPEPAPPAESETGDFSFSHEIRFDHVSFAYPGSDPLFTDFTAVIPCRQITGIMGESGLGKTTLIDLVAGLQSPVKGSITIDKQELTEAGAALWKRKIGYLPQDSLFVDGSFRENLVWDTPGTLIDTEIWSTLEQVNAAHLVRRYPEMLEATVVNFPYAFSGGERQRLALARVLLRKPRLLLLDEATSSLDADNEKQIMELLTYLKREVTILFVTHRTSLLPWFDQVIRL